MKPAAYQYYFLLQKMKMAFSVTGKPFSNLIVPKNISYLFIFEKKIKKNE